LVIEEKGNFYLLMGDSVTNHDLTPSRSTTDCGLNAAQPHASDRRPRLATDLREKLFAFSHSGDAGTVRRFTNAKIDSIVEDAQTVVRLRKAAVLVSLALSHQTLALVGGYQARDFFRDVSPLTVCT